MLNFAIETARDAGRILLEKFGRIDAVTKKGDINLVTEADLASEALDNRTYSITLSAAFHIGGRIWRGGGNGRRRRI